MKPKEWLRDYTNRFFENRNTCVSVRDDQVVDSYKKAGATTIPALMDVVNMLINTDKAMVNQFDYNIGRDTGTSDTTGDSSSKLHKRPFEVLATEGRRPSMFNLKEFNVALDSPCGFH
jgi:hypothetical protein